MGIGKRFIGLLRVEYTGLKTGWIGFGFFECYIGTTTGQLLRVYSVPLCLCPNHRHYTGPEVSCVGFGFVAHVDGLLVILR